MAVRPVSSTRIQENYNINLLGKTKNESWKQIYENDLSEHKNVITAVSATSKDLNTETLTTPDHNQPRQRNGGISDFTARNFCYTDNS